MAAVPGSLRQYIGRPPLTELSILVVTSVVLAVLVITLNDLIGSGVVEWTALQIRVVGWGLGIAFTVSLLPLAYWAFGVVRRVRS